MSWLSDVNKPRKQKAGYEAEQQRFQRAEQEKRYREKMQAEFRAQYQVVSRNLKVLGEWYWGKRGWFQERRFQIESDASLTAHKVARWELVDSLGTEYWLVELRSEPTHREFLEQDVNHLHFYYAVYAAPDPTAEPNPLSLRGATVYETASTAEQQLKEALANAARLGPMIK